MTLSSFARASGAVLLLGGCNAILGLGDFSDQEDGAGAPGGSSGSTSSSTQAAQGGGGATATGTGASSDGGTGGGVGVGGADGGGGSAPIIDCDNQIQDPGEGGVDCGGPCPPCETPCPGTHTCAPQVPVDWTGPVALTDVASGCGADFPKEEVTLRSNLMVPAGSCDCNCGVPAVVCNDSMNAVGYSGANCTTGEGQEGINENECYNQLQSYTHAVTLPNAAATCAKGTVTDNLPAPTWGSEKVSCGGFGEAGVCPGNGELCVPPTAAPFDAGQVCIVRAGTHGCPAGYPNLNAVNGNFQDDRDCPATCSCTATGSTCSVTVNTYSSANCVGLTGSKKVTSGSSTCVITGAINSMKPGVVSVNNAGTCQEGTATMTGTVTPVDPITVCCM